MKAEDAGERLYAPGAGMQQALYFPWIFPEPDAQHLSRQTFRRMSSFLSPTKRRLRSSNGFSTMSPRKKNRARISARWRSVDEVQQEDIGLCENVQRGLRSSTYDRGTLLRQA